MKQFIESLKCTSYYNKFFERGEVIAIYILGSRSIGIIDEQSDYDIVVITTDGEIEDPSNIEYLKYQGRKVHWYFRPITTLLSIHLKDLKGHLCPMQLRNLHEGLVIYSNPKYKTLLDVLNNIKNELSVLGAYTFYMAKEKYIAKILADQQILESSYSKILYHLCWASYYLTNEEPNEPFLASIKRIKWRPVPQEYKDLAVQRLQIYKNYIDNNPLDIVTEIQNAQAKLMSCLEE